MYFGCDMFVQNYVGWVIYRKKFRKTSRKYIDLDQNIDKL
jgi:hypothetical protein